MNVLVVDAMVPFAAPGAPPPITMETVKDAARAYLAERGFDPMNGARPLGRVIQDEIKRPLTDELLFGALASGGTVRVGHDGAKLTFAYTAHVPAVAPTAPRPPATVKPNPETVN